MHPVPVRAFNKGCTIRLVEIPSNKLLTTAFAGHPVFVSDKRSCMHCSIALRARPRQKSINFIKVL